MLAGTATTLLHRYLITAYREKMEHSPSEMHVAHCSLTMGGQKHSYAPLYSRLLSTLEQEDSYLFHMGLEDLVGKSYRYRREWLLHAERTLDS
jgi:hypothetical protein